MTEPLFELPEQPPEPEPPGRRPVTRTRAAPVPQPSLFSAVLAEPRPADLAGLLAAGGQVTRLGGTARVSVVVSERWRATALLAALDERDLAGSRVPTVDDNIGVRTAFSAPLAGLAADWLHGTVTRPPTGFVLTGVMLRLWVISAGRPDSIGYLLCLPTAEASWYPLQAALRGAGMAGELLPRAPVTDARATARDDGHGGAGPTRMAPALRVTGRAARRALRDLIGPAPDGPATQAWP